MCLVSQSCPSSSGVQSAQKGYELRILEYVRDHHIQAMIVYISRQNNVDVAEQISFYNGEK